MTGLQLALTAADQLVLEYAALPRCKSGGPALCSKGTVVATLKAYSRRAYDAVKTAGVMAAIGGEMFDQAVAAARTSLADLNTAAAKR